MSTRFVPSLDEFCAHASAGHNLIPVYCEVVADTETPVSVYARLGRPPYSFLLESVLGGARWAAYSFIGIDPHGVLTIEDGQYRWQTRAPSGELSTVKSGAAPDPVATLRAILASFRPVDVPGLPRFSGGAVGFFAYDVVRALETLPALAAPHPAGLPTARFVVTDTLVIFDNLRQTLKVVANAIVDGDAPAAYANACARIDKILDQLRAPPPSLRRLQPGQSRQVTPRSNLSREAYLQGVETAKQHIIAGDIFQVVLSQRFEVDAPKALPPFDLYRALRVVNPSPYMFHLELDDSGGHVTGASPEVLVRVEDGRVMVRPLAGTRRRGATATEDAALEAELLADPKERAEHVMLIDLGRNDVGRVCKLGTVRVPESFVVERYSHVMHLVSMVEGDLQEGTDALAAFAACFPAGTLSGAPKIRAMEIIEALEPERRGLYGGAVGYVSFDGNLDMAIAIRTFVGRGGKLYLQAGAGIVADSDPVAEFEETRSKARALIRALEMLDA